MLFQIDHVSIIIKILNFLLLILLITMFMLMLMILLNKYFAFTLLTHTPTILYT